MKETVPIEGTRKGHRGGLLKRERLKDSTIEGSIKRGGGKEGLFGGRNEDFCNKNWGISCEKKVGGLSRAAARTGKVR